MWFKIMCDKQSKSIPQFVSWKSLFCWRHANSGSECSVINFFSPRRRNRRPSRPEKNNSRLHRRPQSHEALHREPRGRWQNHLEWLETTFRTGQFWISHQKLTQPYVFPKLDFVLTWCFFLSFFPVWHSVRMRMHQELCLCTHGRWRKSLRGCQCKSNTYSETITWFGGDSEVTGNAVYFLHFRVSTAPWSRAATSKLRKVSPKVPESLQRNSSWATWQREQPQLNWRWISFTLLCWCNVDLKCHLEAETYLARHT